MPFIIRNYLELPQLLAYSKQLFDYFIIEKLLISYRLTCLDVTERKRRFEVNVK